MIPQMINEARDSIRYGYATGWAHLAAVADRVSALAYKGRLSDTECDQIHDHLREVFGALDRLFDEGRDRLAIDDDDGCCRTYSDGSPVYSIARPAGQLPSPDVATYCGDIAPVDLEIGAAVIVAEPPHLR